jgi:hypothetical protein
LLEPEEALAELDRQRAADHASEEEAMAADRAYFNALKSVQRLRAEASTLEGQYKELQIAVSQDGDHKPVKIVASPSEPGSDGSNILARAVATMCVLLAASPKQTKGVVVKNDDSYVNVKARQSLALSGYGPVLVESDQVSVADMLRSSIFDQRLPKPVLAPELSEAEPDYETGKAVILRSQLVRALAREISLKATLGVLAQSERQIQLLAGSSPEGLAARREAQALERAAEAAYQGFSKAMGTPEESAALLALLEAGQAWLSADRGLKSDQDFASGILLKTQEPSMDVTVQTASPDSKIELIQGAADRAAPPPGASMLSITSEKAMLKAGERAKLTLSSAGKSAVLSGDARSKMTIKLNDVAIEAGPGTAITLKNGQAEIQAPTSVTLTQGENSITLDQSGVTLKSTALIRHSGQLHQIN